MPSGFWEPLDGMRLPRQDERYIRVVIPRVSEKVVAILDVIVTEDTLNRVAGFNLNPTQAVFRILKDATTAWITHTDAGRRRYERESDLNIGDLLGEIGGGIWERRPPSGGYDSLSGYLVRHGIVCIQGVTYESDDLEHSWDFDDKVYDEQIVEKAIA